MEHLPPKLSIIKILQKVKKIKIGKIKYATKNSILESLTGFRKQKVIDLLRNKTFNEMSDSQRLMAQIKLLEAQNKRLEMENDFLKKLEEIERRR